MEYMKWDDSCPIYQTLEIIGKKWSLFIIFLIWNWHSSYNNILKTISGLNSKILSERLKNLEDQGIVKRTIVSDRPVKIEYSLTKKGEKIQSLFEKIKNISLEEWEIFEDACGLFK